MSYLRARYQTKEKRTRLVIFIGSNPSNSAPFSVFTDTRSNDRLQSWIKRFRSEGDVLRYKMINVSNKATDKNRPLRISEIRKALPELKSRINFFCEGHQDVKLIALGGAAGRALSMLELPYYHLPHPSPKNRKLNDKKKLNEELKKCRKWIWK